LLWRRCDLVAFDGWYCKVGGHDVDSGKRTDLLWSTSGNWDVGIPTLSSDVIFSDPVPNPGSLGNPNVITLGAGSLANSLSFSTSYTLAGGDLTLGSGSVSVVLGSQSVIDSKLTGASGLLKQGCRRDLSDELGERLHGGRQH
jgi:hypothetical protein